MLENPGVFGLLSFAFLMRILSCHGNVQQGNDYCSITKKHTMCLPEGHGPRCVRPSSHPVTQFDIEEILRVHNEFRAKVANGYEMRGRPGPQPPAADMLEMQWDDELANVAQKHADQCKFAHECGKCRKVRRFKNVGQNLYIYKRTSRHAATNWTRAITEFYNEVTLFNKAWVKPFKFKAAIGHYTAMLWSTTYKIGCGMTQHREGKWYSKLYTCDYAPGGNFVNGQMYEIGNPCTSCPSDTTCSTRHPGLCALGTGLDMLPKPDVFSSPNSIFQNTIFAHKFFDGFKPTNSRPRLRTTNSRPRLRTTNSRPRLRTTNSRPRLRTIGTFSRPIIAAKMTSEKRTSLSPGVTEVVNKINRQPGQIKTTTTTTTTSTTTQTTTLIKTTTTTRPMPNTTFATRTTKTKAMPAIATTTPKATKATPKMTTTTPMPNTTLATRTTKTKATPAIAMITLATKTTPKMTTMTSTMPMPTNTAATTPKKATTATIVTTDESTSFAPEIQEQPNRVEDVAQFASDDEDNDVLFSCDFESKFTCRVTMSGKIWRKNPANLNHFYENILGPGDKTELFFSEMVQPPKNGVACVSFRYKKFGRGAEMVPLQTMAWPLKGKPLRVKVLKNSPNESTWIRAQVTIRKLNNPFLIVFRAIAPDDVDKLVLGIDDVAVTKGRC